MMRRMWVTGARAVMMMLMTMVIVIAVAVAVVATIMDGALLFLQKSVWVRDGDLTPAGQARRGLGPSTETEGGGQALEDRGARRGGRGGAGHRQVRHRAAVVGWHDAQRGSKVMLEGRGRERRHWRRGLVLLLLLLLLKRRGQGGRAAQATR